MQSIKDAVESVMCVLEKKRKGLGGANPEDLLKKTLTKKELAHIKFQYLYKGILGVSVDSSSWLYHLSLKKEDLLAKVNQGSNRIKDIRFRIGEVK